MQNRIRESRCSQIYGKFRKSQASCFCGGKLVFLFSLIFLLSSCAHQRALEPLLTPEQKITLLKDSLGKLCLSSEGKGRLIFLSERYSFSYESLLEEKLFAWTLGIEVPMLGQEIFKLNYKNAFEGQVLPQGNFYERLRFSAQKEKQSQYHLEILDSYLLAMGKLLIFRKNSLALESLSPLCEASSGKKNQGTCRLGLAKENLNWEFSEDVFSLSFPLETGESFLLEAQKLENNSFRRFKMKLVNKKDLGLNKRPLEIDLSLSECHE